MIKNQIQTVERSEIFRNEYGFLHIHTRGLYGKDVFVELREYDSETEMRPVKSKDENSDKRTSLKKHQVRNNVLSIPYSMEAVLADFDEDYLTSTESKCIELYTRVHYMERDINQGTKSELMYLFLKGKAPDPVTLSTTQVKTTIDEDDLLMLHRTDANCSLEFRPQPDYKGEYGFDWIRNLDTLDYLILTMSTGHDPFNDRAFKKIMGKYCIPDPNTRTSRTIIQPDINSNDGNLVKDSDPMDSLIFNPKTGDFDVSFRDGKMYDRLTKEYIQLLFKWEDPATKSPFRTYTPVMTMLIRDKDDVITPKTAKLGLFLDVKEEPEKIVLEFNHPKAKEYLSLSQEVYTGFQKGKTNFVEDNKWNLEITCNAEFEDEYILFARAFGVNDPKGMICGMLRILPNATQFQRKINLAAFNVQTGINPGIEKEDKGKSQNSIKRMKIILGQALVIVNDEVVSLDMRNQPDFIANCCSRTDNPNYQPLGFTSCYILDYSKIHARGGFIDLLESTRNSKYNTYFRLYYIDEHMVEKDASGKFTQEKNGFSVPDVSPGLAFCFTSSGEETGGHEVGHSLGLAHTFEGVRGQAKYTYKAHETDNLMDYYQGTRNSLYYWQWKLINNQLK